MALTQEDVNAWAAANPNASNAEIAAAINSVGGISALEGLNLGSIFSNPSSSATSVNWDGGSGLQNVINLGNGQYITPTYSDTGKLTKIESSGWNNGANSIWGESGNYDPRVPSSAGGLFGSIENVLGKATNAINPINTLVGNTVGKLTPEQTALLIMGAAALSGGTINPDALAADNIDVGGGWNPATGAGDAATAAAAAATGVTSSAGTPHLFTPSGLDLTNAAATAGSAIPATIATAGTGTTAGTIGSTGLTASQLASLAKAGVSVAGLLGGAKLAGSLAGGGSSNLSLTPQNRAGVSSGSAQYSPEYYQAIQAKYNQMMPQQPRDVTTDLKNWYETKYTPKVA